MYKMYHIRYCLNKKIINTSERHAIPIKFVHGYYCVLIELNYCFSCVKIRISVGLDVL